MQVLNPNNIKIYNLSSGDSLPEWLDERQRRLALKKDVSLRKRIQLIQDFDMPEVSTCIKMSPDNQYIFATGMYKPRVKCFDVSQMSMKFERCMDAEAIKFHILSPDYTKLVFLQSDRYIEFHNQAGRLHRTRIPFYGRDLDVNTNSPELFFVGISKQISRFNMADGRFMAPLLSHCQELNCCKVNARFGLFACGSSEGVVECWDTRVRKRAAAIQAAMGLGEVTAVSSMEFDEAYNMGVGFANGNISVYDLRMNSPLTTFDHRYDLPIKAVHFHQVDDLNLVLSIDKRILKIWNRDTGKPLTYIEPEVSINDLCVVPHTGLIFMTNESTRMNAYFIPDLGQPPRWCSFLTSLTEELEEDQHNHLYDGYKFLTREQVVQMGMSHLIGSNLLRAEMHGYCVREEVVEKAKSLGAMKYSEYKENKLAEELKPQNRIKQTQKLPRVNTALAEVLQSVPKNFKDYQVSRCQLEDERFKEMFMDNLFTVDQNSSHYQRVNPVISTAHEDKNKEESSESSDEEDKRQQIKEQKKKLKEEKKKEGIKMMTQVQKKDLKMVELNSQNHLQDHKKTLTLINKSFSQRIREDTIIEKNSMFGNKEMTFTLKKTDRKKQLVEHHNERKKTIRPATNLKHSKNKQF